MIALTFHRIRVSAWKRLGIALGIVITIATVCGFAGYAAAVSYPAWLNLPPVDAVKIGTSVFMTMGVIGAAAAFFYLGIHG